jgi:hypothetical protein
VDVVLPKYDNDALLLLFDDDDDDDEEEDYDDDASSSRLNINDADVGPYDDNVIDLPNRRYCKEDE